MNLKSANKEQKEKTMDKLVKLKKLADAMYYAAQNLTTDVSLVRLHKAMDEYHKFIIYEYHNEEPVSEDLEEAADNCYYRHHAFARESFIEGAQWQKQQMMKDAISCEVEWYDGLYLNFTQETLDEVLSNKGIEAGNKVKVIVLKV